MATAIENTKECTCLSRKKHFVVCNINCSKLKAANNSRSSDHVWLKFTDVWQSLSLSQSDNRYNVQLYVWQLF